MGQEEVIFIHTPAPPRATHAPPIPKAERAATNAVAEHDGNELEHGGDRELIVQPHPDDVSLHDLEDVIQIDRPECASEDESDDCHAERFELDRLPDLPTHGADGAKHPELPSSVGNRHRQRVDDAKYSHEHGDRYLQIHQTEPLVGYAQDVPPAVLVRQNEHVSLARVALDDPLADVANRCLTSDPDVKITDRVIVPVFDEDGPIHEDGALLVGVVHDHADDRQANHPIGSWDVEDITNADLAQLREVVRHDQSLAGGRSAGTCRRCSPTPGCSEWFPESWRFRSPRSLPACLGGSCDCIGTSAPARPPARWQSHSPSPRGISSCGCRVSERASRTDRG